MNGVPMVMICWVSISCCDRPERTIEKPGASADQVDLEKALAVSDRLGGHIVSGHVDGLGTVSRINEHTKSRLRR